MSSGCIEVVVSSVTERGVLPQFRQKFDHPVEAVRRASADDYERAWRVLAARAGTMIRVDRS